MYKKKKQIQEKQKKTNQGQSQKNPPVLLNGNNVVSQQFVNAA